MNVVVNGAELGSGMLVAVRNVWTALGVFVQSKNRTDWRLKLN